MNAWSHAFTPPYAIMVWCLLKHRNNFAFTVVVADNMYITQQTYIMYAWTFWSFNIGTRPYVNSLYVLVVYSQCDNNNDDDPADDYDDGMMIELCPPIL